MKVSFDLRKSRLAPIKEKSYQSYDTKTRTTGSTHSGRYE